MRSFKPAWLVATAKPRRRAYGSRKRSGSLAISAAIRRASSLVSRFMLMRRPDSSSKQIVSAMSESVPNNKRLRQVAILLQLLIVIALIGAAIIVMIF